MSSFYARAVFFVADVEQSRRHYVDELGFALDWDSNDGVLQVSLHGCEIILNHEWGRTKGYAGHGRVFVGLEDDQAAPLKQHLLKHNIQTFSTEWGRQTLIVRDLDGNEIFFWLVNDDFSGIGKAPIVVSGSGEMTA